MKKYRSCIYVSLLFTITFCQKLYSTVTIERPVIDETAHNDLDIFLQPIKFTDSGLRCFIKHVLNNPNYKDFFSVSLSHPVQLLKYPGQNREYAYSVLQLFKLTLIKTPYMSAFAVEEFLSQLPELLKQYFDNKNTLIEQPLTEKFNALLYTKFLNEFATFKQKPREFLYDLSNSLTAIVQENYAPLRKRENTEHTKLTISSNKLRKTIIRFIELAINKICWSAQEQEEIWRSIKSMASSITTLAEQGIINDPDDLDILYWALLSRFDNFIDLAGASLSLKTYETIEKDLITNSVPFIQFEEQEEELEPKENYLKRVITIGKAKALAYSTNIQTMPIAVPA